MSIISCFTILLLATVLCTAYGGHGRFMHYEYKLLYILDDSQKFGDLIAHLPSTTQKQYTKLEAKVSQLPDNYKKTFKMNEIFDDNGGIVASYQKTEIKETTVNEEKKTKTISYRFIRKLYV